jgi:hypothetical protein
MLYAPAYLATRGFIAVGDISGKRHTRAILRRLLRED